METFPIDERKLLASIPGFEDLAPKEAARISVDGFEYWNDKVLLTADLFFVYRNESDRSFKLKLQLAGNRPKDRFFAHVLYEETVGDEWEEKEFPNVRAAIDYCEGKS